MNLKTTQQKIPLLYSKIYAALQQCREKSLKVKVTRGRRVFRYDEDDCDILEFLDITPEEYLKITKPNMKDEGYGTFNILDRLVKLASAKIRAELRVTEGCPYIMKSGKNKGNPCGKLDCKKHQPKDEEEDENSE
jgi:hypothetical protein